VDARARRGPARSPRLGLALLSVLVVNAGSTSLKLSLVSEDETSHAIGALEEAPRPLEAVAHRIVHGGTRFREPVLIDDDVQRGLIDLTELAPLHNGAAVAAVDAARRAFPDVRHVAVFDSAFHATLPDSASTYALPRRWREEWEIRRYGFHGLSVQWSAEQVTVPRLVVCHLGGGSSVTAVLNGRSVETTMGFSPLEGVPMVTRCGSIDAEIVLHLLRTRRLTLDEIEWALEHGSGLAGLSGLSGRVEELESSDAPEARLALEVYSYRVAGAIGAAAVALGGLDAVVFTAGVGEGSARVRADVCSRLAFLGVELDLDANLRGGLDVDVAAAASRVRVVVVHAREDVIAARAARSLL
jgi:acetate kinase